MNALLTTLSVLSLLGPSTTLAPAQRRQVSAEGRSSPAPAERAEPSHPITRGSVSVLDREGRWRDGLDSQFALWRLDSGESAGVVDVVGGAWSAELLPGVSYQVSWGVTDDRAWVNNPELSAGSFRALEARLQQEPLLVVFDRRTGHELNDVTVILDGSMPPHVFPNENDIERPWWGVEGVPSPVQLEYDSMRPDWPSRSFWVRAPGYAWQRVKVDVSWPGEMLVGLEPGGALEVHAEQTTSRVVSVFRMEQGRTALVARRAGRFTLEDLQPGEYLVDLYITDREAPFWGASHGARQVNVRAGETTLVRFDAPPLDEPAPRGGLVVESDPRAAPSSSPRAIRPDLLAADPENGPLPAIVRDDVLQLSGPDDASRWVWKDVPAGDYLVRIVVADSKVSAERRVQYARATVEPGRTTEVQATELPARRLTVSATDAETGLGLQTSLSCIMTSRTPAWSGDRQALIWVASPWDAGIANFTLFSGQEYAVLSSGHLPSALRVPEGECERLEVALRRGASARLRCFDRGRPMLLEAWGWHPFTFQEQGPFHARHADPDVEVHTIPRNGYTTDAYEFTASAPGRIFADVTPPAGYLPVPTIEIEVDLGPPREVRVDLERIPSLR